jgi:hypothetical protein
MALAILLAGLLPGIAAPATAGTAEQAQLAAATLFGEGDDDAITDLEIGPDGTIYVAGWTESPDLPTTPGAFDRTLGGERDAFVARFSPDLSTLLAATFIGGGTGSSVGTWDAAQGLEVTPTSVFLTGYTYTEDFPVTAGAFDTDNALGGASAFVVELSLDLEEVLHGTYLGESDTDYGFAVAQDLSGDLVVVGFTIGSHFPTTDGAYDTVGGPFQDIFVSRLSADLGTLVASTLVPNGIGTDLALDPTGVIFVSGYTSSPEYPTTPGAWDRSCGSDGLCDPEGFGIIHSDVFVARLDGALTALEASTFLGHDGDDEPSDLVLDGTGGLYVSGTSSSSVFPTTPGAYQSASNGFNTAFVSRLDIDLEDLQVSTRLGGFQPLSGTEGHGMTFDGERIYVTGETFAADFPTTPDAFDDVKDGANEVIVSVFDSELSNLLFSSMLGGDAGSRTEEDRGRSVAVAEDGSIYLSGRSASPNFPTTPGAFQESPAGDFDGFVARVDPGLGGSELEIALEPLDAPIVLPPSGGSFRYRVSMTNYSDSARTVDFWRQLGLPAGGGRTLAPRAVTLPPGATIERTLRQSIPAGAPAGVYTLTGYLGDYPSGEVSDGFEFEKSAAAR